MILLDIRVNLTYKIIILTHSSTINYGRYYGWNILIMCGTNCKHKTTKIAFG